MPRSAADPAIRLPDSPPGPAMIPRRLVTMAATAMCVTAVSMTASAEDDRGGSLAFDQYCIACHGPDARGIANLGVNLVGSVFVDRASMEQLVEFLKVGRPADDPASLSTRPMPGFSWVSESELESIAAFLKSLGTGK